MINCDVEESVPIPARKSDDYLYVRQRASAACYTAKRLKMEGYEEPQIDTAKTDGAIKKVLESAARGIEPSVQVASAALATTDGAFRTNVLLSEFDMVVVQDAKRLRNYVTNKLILESENMDPRIRIKALELLGKISDVGLFTERTEVTVTNKSTNELESTLKEKLRRLMGKESAEDAEIINPPIVPAQKIDVARELEGL
jgi:hypothetical protein